VSGGTAAVVAIRPPTPSRPSSRVARERRITTFFEQVARLLASTAIERGVYALPSLPEPSTRAYEAPHLAVLGEPATPAEPSEAAVLVFAPDERRASA
jgi:hypothetical protein